MDTMERTAGELGNCITHHCDKFLKECKHFPENNSEPFENSLTEDTYTLFHSFRRLKH